MATDWQQTMQLLFLKDIIMLRRHLTHEREDEEADKVKMSSRPKNDRLNKSDIKKQTWRAGNMLYPVPAVMVSCARKGEKPNIITVAWAGTVCSDPAMVSISVRKERYSHDIIKETGEFVINLTTNIRTYL